MTSLIHRFTIRVNYTPKLTNYVYISTVKICTNRKLTNKKTYGRKKTTYRTTRKCV